LYKYYLYSLFTINENETFCHLLNFITKPSRSELIILVCVVIDFVYLFCDFDFVIVVFIDGVVVIPMMSVHVQEQRFIESNTQIRKLKVFLVIVL
jgi:hypothetical protein